MLSRNIFRIQLSCIFSDMSVEISAAEEDVAKPIPEAVAPKRNTWLTTVISLLLYIVVYYALFRSFRHIFLLVVVILIHEGGHYVAMKIFGYKDIRLFFIPFIGGFVSGSSYSVTPYQRSLMILAGPIPGIFMGMFLLSAFALSGNQYLLEAAILFLLLNAFNLIPLSPLDGGQLLQTVYFNTNYTVQTIFTILSVIAVCVIVFFTRNYLILVLALFLLNKLKKSYDLHQLRKKLIKEGVALDKPYILLSDEEYAVIHKILLKLFPEWDSPYDRMSNQEREIAALAQVLLPASSNGLISNTQKTYLTLLWIAGLAVPLFALIHYFNTLR